MKKEVVIIGAGPAGLATAACLNAISIPNLILEKEDTYAHLWKRKAYDRLKLHLAKEFCALPHLRHSDSAPKYIPRDEFVRYLDEYVTKFNLSPVYNTVVESASFNEKTMTWTVKTRDLVTGHGKDYIARFLVVATGENAEGFVPDNIPGLKGFGGEIMHSSQYKSGADYQAKRVLVVGCGNSGMEIAYDLSNFGAMTSIAIRSSFHVMTKELIYLGMCLVKYLPVNLIDSLILVLARIHYGDLSKYGIVRPSTGPLLLKKATGRSAVIDVGTVGKIKTGEIKVVKEPASVNGNEVTFKDGYRHHFDVIVFATGYRSTANNWLKDDHGWLLNQYGFPKEKFPNHWKGRNGLYCVGLARSGLAGIAVDAQSVADDIEMVCRSNGTSNLSGRR